MLSVTRAICVLCCNWMFKYRQFQAIIVCTFNHILSNVMAKVKLHFPWNGFFPRREKKIYIVYDNNKKKRRRQRQYWYYNFTIWFSSLFANLNTGISWLPAFNNNFNCMYKFVAFVNAQYSHTHTHTPHQWNGKREREKKNRRKVLVRPEARDKPKRIFSCVKW